MSANFALEWQPLLLSNLAKQKELVLSTGRSFTVRKHSSWEKNTLLHYCHEPWTPSIKSNPNHIDNAHNSTKVDFLLRPSRLLTFPKAGIGAGVMLFTFTIGIWPLAGGHYVIASGWEESAACRLPVHYILHTEACSALHFTHRDWITMSNPTTEARIR